MKNEIRAYAKGRNEGFRNGIQLGLAVAVLVFLVAVSILMELVR